MKTYALIYFENKKIKKIKYDTAMKAFYDYQNKGCTKVELFNEHNQLLSSYERK